jgi:hypothetical protein
MSAPPRIAPFFSALLLVACGGEGVSEARGPGPGGPAQVSTAPAVDLRLPDPRPPVTSIVMADWLSELGDRYQVRDFDGITAAFAADFSGHDPFAVPEREARALPLAAQRSELGEPPVADRATLGASVEARLGPWRRVVDAHWSVVHAQFAPPEEGDTWGAADVLLHLAGEDAFGGREALDLALRMRVTLADGRWSIDAWRLVAGEVTRQPTPLFVDVTRPAGVHHEGVRFGQPGNDSDRWNGVAGADVDGDGRWDVFLPGQTRSFLYMGDGTSSFREETEERGLGDEVGGTGAVFFDYDNDGDQDLAVAHVGWRNLDEQCHGRPLALYENDGEGRFTEVGAARGFARYLPAYSLVAFDADGDGYTDLFVCGYGRMDDIPNDSWIEALNGAPDLLLRNVGGTHFEDTTRESGIRDRSWTYSAAAADYDRDGDLDLYVANNFGSNKLWRNDGKGRFEDVAGSLGVAARGITFGCAWTDLNQDGRLDLYLTRPASTTGNRILERLEGRRADTTVRSLYQMTTGNRLFLGLADGRFEETELGATGKAGWAWTPVCADLDLDGLLDVYCVNGFVTGDLPQDT